MVLGDVSVVMEEVGELASALAGDDEYNKEEVADVFAWLCTLANINGIDLQRRLKIHRQRRRGLQVTSKPRHAIGHRQRLPYLSDGWITAKYCLRRFWTCYQLAGSVSNRVT